MINLSRRDFSRLLGATAATATLSAPSLVRAQGKARIVVIGGGFGGTAAARNLKRWAPEFDVTLVEPAPAFITCPYSNLVLAGRRDLASITHGYDKVKAAGITVIQDSAAGIDATKRQVKLAGGKVLDYDRLIVSPGIDLRWGGLEGYNEADAQLMPHAWKAGPQTLLLRKQLEAMPDGGTFVMVAPANPFRCPPGPYERASMVAEYFKQAKPKSKILILDAKESFSKQPLFLDAWQKLYPGMIEWVSLSKDGKVTKIDTKAGTVETELGTVHKADVANVIPPQFAGKIARDAGLADASGWCPVQPRSFESKQVPNIHVIGDASNAAPMPKSGFAAASQGKVAAAAVIALTKGKPLQEPTWVNACYSHVGTDYAISIAGVYRATEKGLVEVEGAGGISPRQWDDSNRKLESHYADGWYENITTDIWG